MNLNRELESVIYKSFKWELCQDSKLNIAGVLALF